mgnify:CR=1 FL=1
MSITMSRWVLWVALIILVPVPLLSQGGWCWVPVFRVAQLLWRDLVLGPTQWLLSVSVILQAGAGAVVLALLAYSYGAVSAQWPVKIRGSVMSLAMFVGLVLLASIPVYRPLLASTESLLTFMTVYN